MKNNLLASTYRLFRKRKGYYVVNILSLIVGLVATGFTFLYVNYELSYDDSHENAEHIYRVSAERSSGWFAAIPREYSDAIYQGSIPELITTTRVRRWFATFLYAGEQKFYESKVLITDPGSKFFQLFDFPFTEGSREDALREPNSVIISSSLARKYFGNKSAIDELVRLDTMELKVTGVFQDLPGNSNFDFQMLVANQVAMDMASGHFVFALMNDAALVDDVEEKVKTLPLEVKSFSQVTNAKLIPLTDLHFESNMTYEQKTPGNFSYLIILGAVGLTILIIAVANFVNLSIALYAYRSKEIAVRKSLGATARKLALQFLGESTITILGALALSVLVIYLLLPSFNDFLQVQIIDLFSTSFVSFMLVAAGTIALLSAIYPVAFLPGLRVLDLFKSAGITNQHGLRLRQILLGAQFAILFAVTISLWIIHEQFKLISSKDLGFDKEGVVKITRSWNIDSTNYWRLKAEFKSHPSIRFVSEGLVPGDEDYGFPFRAENSTEILEGIILLNTDYEYLDVLGLSPLQGLIAEGQNLQLPKKSCVINETAAKLLGYENAVGQKLVLNPGQDGERTVTIDGVVKDYNFNSLHQVVGPHVLFLNQESKYIDANILVKISGTDLKETIGFIEKKLAEIVPGTPTGIELLEEDLNRLYIREQKTSEAIQILVTLTIVLAFTGLVALCSYMIGFRMREIAIRKVLGAQDLNIVKLFSSAFITMMLVAFVIGGGVAYWSMAEWVATFAYRTAINGTVYVVVFAGVATITLLLASLQVLRATSINPVKILRQD